MTTPAARSVGRGVFPLDEQLALGALTLAPRLVEQCVLLGTLLPFPQAVDVLARFTGVRLSAETARRLTETAGRMAVALDTAAVAELEQTLPAPPLGPPVQLLSVDGCMAPLVGGQWAEVKTLALGTVSSRLDRAGVPVPQTVALSYFSRLTDADTFGWLATVETHQRGTETAGTVVAVVDGADWCQGVIDLHRSDAVRILDAPHALGYLATAAQAQFPDDAAHAATWLAVQTQTLLRGDPEAVLLALRCARDAVAPAGGAAETLTQVLGYLEPRREQITYAAFRAAGYPIGSGCVESANKLVVEARLKGRGMHWARGNVDPLLALRCRYHNDRWAAAWTPIWGAWRTTPRHPSARQPPVPGSAPAAVAPLPPSAPAPTPVPILPPRPKLVVNGKPTAHHPWRARRHVSSASA